MDPENSITPVTRTIEEFINTRFSPEEYMRLESQMYGAVKDSPLVERFTRQFLGQTGYMYHFAPRTAREDILEKGIKLGKANISNGELTRSAFAAWFSPNPTMYPQMIEDLLMDQQKSGLDIYRVKTTPTILSKTFLDPYHTFAGKTSSSIINAYEAGGQTQKGLGFLEKYLKGIMESGKEIEVLPKLGFIAPVAEAVAVIDEAESFMPAELFIPDVKNSREFVNIYDSGAANFEEMLAKRLQLKKAMSPADRMLSENVLAEVRAAKDVSTRALEGIKPTPFTSAKLTPKTFNKIMEAGNTAASIMRFVRGL